ncbi:MAG: 30S ribosome-binding factor RbfA [Planctomycetota bacterium]|jgi:ribosome-binding factor A
MAEERRLKRLENVLLQAVAPLISHGLVDPRLNLVTVTRIRLSADLSTARVNWSCLGSESERTQATHALEHARGRLQAAVARAMRTRTTPRLEFHYDPSLEKSVRISRILDDLARERAEKEGDGSEEEGEST